MLHLRQVWKQTGKKPRQLVEKPECPPELIYIWNWFNEVVSPPERLTYTEITNWAELNGHSLTPDEVKTLRMLDAIRIKVLNENV